jgi:predicted SprT family Zn-dependent metalloprotease
MNPMWYRYADNLMPTRPLAEKIASYFEKELNQNDEVRKYRDIQKRISNIDYEIKKAKDQNQNLLSLLRDRDSLARQMKLEAFDSLEYMTVEANRMIAESELFKDSDPPTVRFQLAGKDQQGSYYFDDNTIYINSFLLMSPWFDCAGILAHELAHAMQYKYDAGGALEKARRFRDKLKKNNYDPSTMSLKGTDSGKLKLLYYNHPPERQAFLANIISDLSYIPNPPTDYEGFKDFLLYSPTWNGLVKSLYPENKRSMMKSLYKYYSELPSPTPPQKEP